MNFIEHAIRKTYERAAAKGIASAADADLLALGVVCLIMRGGKAFSDVVQADIAAWKAEHGPLTRNRLERWARTLGPEAGIARAALQQFTDARRRGSP